MLLFVSCHTINKALFTIIIKVLILKEIIMYKLVGRISDGKQIIGYNVTDGQQTISMSKQDVMVLAKQGSILGVKLVGDTLTGTNGFELKKLPTVNQIV